MKKKSVFSLIVLGLVANLAGCQEVIVDSSESVLDSSLESTGTSEASSNIDITSMIECQNITVRRDGRYVEGYKYEYLEDNPVIEYSNKDGSKKIYTDDYYLYYTDEENKVVAETKVYVHESRGGSYEEYYFRDFVGFLWCEIFCYLDVDNRMIDIVIRYSQYKEGRSSPHTITFNNEVIEPNNPLAYECCAKNGYYTYRRDVEYKIVPVADFYLDELDGSLERHRLVTYSEEYTLEYKERNSL